MISAVQKKGPTRVFSEYIAATQYEDIPDHLWEEVKLYVLDSVGCSIGGSRVKSGKIMIQLFEGLGGSPVVVRGRWL